MRFLGWVVSMVSYANQIHWIEVGTRGVTDACMAQLIILGTQPRLNCEMNFLFKSLANISLNCHCRLYFSTVRNSSAVSDQCPRVMQTQINVHSISRIRSKKITDFRYMMLLRWQFLSCGPPSCLPISYNPVLDIIRDTASSSTYCSVHWKAVNWWTTFLPVVNHQSAASPTLHKFSCQLIDGAIRTHSSWIGRDNALFIWTSRWVWCSIINYISIHLNQNSLSSFSPFFGWEVHL